MNTGKTIQIFLPDGNPRSVKIAEITSRTVQAILIPRPKLDYMSSRNELKNVGIYFLIGTSDEEEKALLYVGEAEDCFTRLKQQNTTKDFWNSALAIVSKTKYFTKTHIEFLEYHCYKEAEDAARYVLENSTIPNQTFVPEAMQADLLDNFETIKILVSALGFPIFDHIRKPDKKDILYCKGKEAFAEGEYAEDGLIVFSGSKCNLKETKTAGPWIIGMRERLKKSGILKREGNIYKFTSNYIFSSPSAAAATILGRGANGWTEWKYKDGKTLDEVKRQEKSEAR